jgi:DNA-directed RNA polymerase subunit RPC12/RpoP
LDSHSRNHKFFKKYSCNQWSAQFIKHAALRHHSLICSKSNVNNLNCIDVPAPQKQAQVVTDVKNVEKEHKCLVCGKIFSNYHTFYQHKKKHEGIIYRCAQCPSTFKSINGLHYHSQTVHELRQFECHYCQTTFEAKGILKRHMTVHFNSIFYPCNQCPVVFKTRDRLICHQNSVHTSMSYHCNHCSKIFKSKVKFVSHLREHKVLNKVRKEYKCLECGKIFSSYQKFYHHKKTHEKIYRCVLCTSTYKTTDKFRNHLRTVHELRLFYKGEILDYPQISREIALDRNQNGPTAD